VKIVVSLGGKLRLKH